MLMKVLPLHYTQILFKPSFHLTIEKVPVHSSISLLKNNQCITLVLH